VSDQYPHGKIGSDDEGQLAIRIAADRRYNVVRIDFSKAIHWLALDVESAEGLVRMLEAKIDDIKAGQP
jgi:hypothetical protein